MEITKIKIKKNIWDIIEYVDKAFDDAMTKKASDIHIEPTNEFILVRLRIDWDFIIYDKISNEHTSWLITRFKVLARLKIDENKKPQDWKIWYNSEKLWEEIDIRASTLPTKYWEKVVLRILRQDDSISNVKSLWLLETNYDKVTEILKKKHWIILVAGPTWSWKSTSLFAILKDFNPLEYNISTLEDPIEYDIDFVNQSQIKPEIGYTFASWLRSLVRQDPDIIMVWEIRDKETAKLSIEAALTGHLVLSTIHTNSASATIQRLVNMWIEPFLVSSALNMVVSQRLVKKICPHCKQEHHIDSSVREKIKHELKNIVDSEEIENVVFYKWAWCEKCSWTGYKSRIAVHEVLVIDEKIEEWILGHIPASELQKLAQEDGMITIVQDALLKAVFWETTPEEALKLF